MRIATAAALVLIAAAAHAATIAPGDIAQGPPPPCWGGGLCIATPPPPYVYLLDNQGAQKWSQWGYYVVAFGPNGHLFVAGYGAITEYDAALAVVRTIPRTGTSALTVAQNGDSYALASDGVLTIYAPAGTVKQTISLPFTTGAPWIPPSLDLGADQCTLFYTDFAQTGRRYDVCGMQALPNLAPGSWSAVRAMSDGGYVAASGSTLSIFDAQNHLLRSYTPQVTTIQALAFDVDPHFILAGAESAIDRIRLSDGARTDFFANNTLFLAVNGEQRASAALFATDVPALSPPLLFALAAMLIAIAWSRLK